MVSSVSNVGRRQGHNDDQPSQVDRLSRIQRRIIALVFSLSHWLPSCSRVIRKARADRTISSHRSSRSTADLTQSPSPSMRTTQGEDAAPSNRSWCGKGSLVCIITFHLEIYRYVSPWFSQENPNASLDRLSWPRTTQDDRSFGRIRQPD